MHQQMALPSAFAEAPVGPGISPWLTCSLIKPGLRLKMKQNAQRLQVKALLIQRALLFTCLCWRTLNNARERVHRRDVCRICCRTWSGDGTLLTLLHPLHPLGLSCFPQKQSWESVFTQSTGWWNNQLLWELGITESWNCLESQNHLDWERSLRSLNPTIPPALPISPLTMSPSAISRWLLDTSRDGDFTTALSSLTKAEQPFLWRIFPQYPI